MSLQAWPDAIQNSCTSFNARLRAIATAISGTLGATVQFYPHGQKPDVPAYPYLSAWFLNTGDWDSARRKLLTRIQLDVYTTGSQLGQAQRIAGLVFKNFGFDPVLSVMGCNVSQTDYEAAKAIPPRTALPLHDMQLEIQNGWESQPDEDPAVSHLFTNLNLYFE
jgi:hypothetical protein